MRTLRPISLTLLLTACATSGGGAPGAGPIPEGLILEISEEHYDVFGETSSQIVQEMRIANPSKRVPRGVAINRWNIRWNYDRVQDGEACHTKDITVTVSSHIILPRWVAPTDASESVREWWRGEHRRLKVHEQGHQNIAIDGGRQILEVIQSTTDSLCGPLRNKIDAEARVILDATRAKQREYDDFN